MLERFTGHVLDHEPELRAQLRLSLDRHPADSEQRPFRQGRAIGWIEDALAPLRGRMPDTELRRLVLAIRATTGIEALVWLTDVAGLARSDAAATDALLCPCAPPRRMRRATRRDLSVNAFWPGTRSTGVTIRSTVRAGVGAWVSISRPNQSGERTSATR